MALIRDEYTDRSDLSSSMKNYYRNRESKLEYRRNYKLQNPVEHILNRTRARAKERGIEFNLDHNDIIIPEVCPIFKTPLKFTEKGRDNNTPSVDRVDNSLGYTKNNIKIISWRANRLKNNLKTQDVQSLLQYMEADEIPPSPE